MLGYLFDKNYVLPIEDTLKVYRSTKIQSFDGPVFHWIIESEI